jgi:hypothetical protein
MNVLPELFHCSGFALFGKATKDGTLYHGRILDYMTNAGLQNHAVIIVAKPAGYNGFVNVSFAGSLGSVTGMNARRISIGEMGGRGVGKWDGCPMTFLVRRGLEEAASLDDVMKIFTETPRTCEYYYVFADGNKRDARGVAAVPEKIEFIAPGQADPRLPEAVPDAVLLSAGDRYTLLVERTRAGHGKIGVEEAIRLMDRPVAMQSNLHSVLFVPEKLLAWVAYAGPDGEPAANRTYYGYDFSELLK